MTDRKRRLDVDQALEVLREIPPTTPDVVEGVMVRIRSEASRKQSSGGRVGFAVVAGVAGAVAAMVLLALGIAVDPGPDRAGPEALPKRVQFVYVAEGASGVSVLGTFNDWDAGAHPLVREGNSELWVAEVTLPPGRYEYAYQVDGEWRSDQATAQAVVDEYGSVSSVIVVEQGDDGVAEDHQ